MDPFFMPGSIMSLDEQPDTFNILAISSADYSPTAGTVLYVDNISLDYTAGINREDPLPESNYTRTGRIGRSGYFNFEKPELPESSFSI